MAEVILAKTQKEQNLRYCKRRLQVWDSPWKKRGRMGDSSEIEVFGGQRREPESRTEFGREEKGTRHVQGCSSF